MRNSDEARIRDLESKLETYHAALDSARIELRATCECAERLRAQVRRMGGSPEA